MNNDEFKHLYPIETEKMENEKNKKKIRPHVKSNRVTIINIGQILLICFLFIIIFIQTASIISGSRNSVVGDIYHKDNGADQNADANANLPKPDGEINFNDQQNLNINNIDNASRKNSEIIETIFILGENNGRLAVLSPDGQTVYETFDVYINTLPDYDKNLLQTGIKIKTAEELYSLLEDYNS